MSLRSVALASKHETLITTRVSPLLSPIANSLGCRVVLPGYFGKIDISGQQYLPTDGPIILAPTHRSRWDALIVPCATGQSVTGRDLRFMVSANEMKGMQGWFIRRLGGFPVDPQQPAIASLRCGLDILKHREMMVIFPEGGIFRDGKLHPLKPGLARLALQAKQSQPGLNVKIVPIYIDYGEAFPSWNCDVTVRIGKPLCTSRYAQNLPAERQSCSSRKDAMKQGARKLTADLTNALQALGAESVVEPSSKTTAS
ncbi:MAG: lysophospholipid acyltransferase family protein [Elainellaceae cyanobacterium]